MKLWDRFKETQFWKQWRGFGLIITDPFVLGVAVIAAYSGRAAVLNTTPGLTAIVLTLATSVSTGILGGYVAHQWSTFTERQVMSARGKGAVRGLKLHLASISDLARRTRIFVERCQSTQATPFDTKMALEEILGRCGLLEENVMGSIEDWVDIDPSADIKTQIGEFTRLANEREELRQKVENLNADLAKNKEGTAADKAELERKLDETNRELAATQRELAEKGSSLGGITGPTGVLPTVDPLDSLRKLFMENSLPAGISPSPVFAPKVCSRCNRAYFDSLGTLTTTTLCPECRSQAGLT